MKNFLKLTSLALLISTSFLSCNKDKNGPVVPNGTIEKPLGDGSVENNKPDWSRYIEFSIVNSDVVEPLDFKVGETSVIKLKLKVDFSQNRKNVKMHMIQEVDAGSKLDYSVLGGISEPLTTDTLNQELLPPNPTPNYNSNPNIQGIKTIHSLTGVTNNEEIIYTILYSPRYAMPTILRFQVTLDDNSSETRSQRLIFSFTPEE